MPPETADDVRWKMALEKLEALSNELRERNKAMTNALLQLGQRQEDDKAERKERQKQIDANATVWNQRLATIERTLSTWLRWAIPALSIALIVLVVALVTLSSLAVISQ